MTAGHLGAVTAAAHRRNPSPPSYTAKAVHFDGATMLSIASLAATDNNKFSVAFWFKASSFDGGILYVVDPDGAYAVWGEFQNGGATDIMQAINIAPGSDRLQLYTPNLSLTGAWGFCIATCEANNPDPQPARIYIGGTDQSAGIGFSPSALTFGVNGLKFTVGDDGFSDGLVADIADLRIAPGQSWLTAGDISPATLALFRDPATGKPVDPAIATASLGAPAILFSGDAATFATNQGTGGAFTTTGTLTNAATSPSD